MIGLDEARKLLASRAGPLPAERAPLSAALGATLASPAVSDTDLPPTDVAAMDGYAVRSSDLGRGPLRVDFEVAAGGSQRPLTTGSAARIFTGAPLPVGADTVVPQENSSLTTRGWVELAPGGGSRHVRARGEVITRGAELAPAGARLTPTMTAALAACGCQVLDVVRRPQHAVVVSGNEVVDPAVAPRAGEIRDSNGTQLAALISAAGFSCPTVARVGDSEQALSDAISAALDTSDLVLTTGGVSVGDFDLVPRVVARLGGEVVFHRVRLKPGKPILAARFDSKWLVGLPGNPLAVLVGWRMFAWPLAATLGGAQGCFDEEPVFAVVTEPVAAASGGTELRPACLTFSSAGARVTMVPSRGSHDVVAGARADALARLDPGVDRAVGEAIPCYPLTYTTSWPTPHESATLT